MKMEFEVKRIGWLIPGRKIVPGMGLEPTRTSAHGPQPCLSTNFSTRVLKKVLKNKDFLKTLYSYDLDSIVGNALIRSPYRSVVVIWLGLEPRTLSLKGRCSTN